VRGIQRTTFTRSTAVGPGLARLPLDQPQTDQLAAALDVVRGVLGDRVQAVYLYGSSVMGGLRPNSDLDLLVVALIAMARSHGHPLLGPPPAELLDDVPQADLLEALTGVIPALLADLADDTSNVLLTLARVWQTVETGKFASKDVTADWALSRLTPDEGRSLELARDVYRGTVDVAWQGLQSEASRTADLMVDRIENAASRA
jgi:streptomycin 3"-adenylyltransferase